jgi:hypothetical protein
MSLIPPNFAPPAVTNDAAIGTLALRAGVLPSLLLPTGCLA